jgi:hypothetical protein
MAMKKNGKNRGSVTPSSMRQRCWDIAQPTTKKKNHGWSKNKNGRFVSRLAQIQKQFEKEMAKPIHLREDIV